MSNQTRGPLYCSSTLQCLILLNRLCLCSTPDSGTGGSFNDYRNSRPGALHHFTAPPCSLLFSVKLEKPVSLSFYVFPPSRFVEYCLLFPLSADPCGGGVRWGGGLLTQPSLGVWFSVYFLLAGWSLGVIPIGWSSFLVVT